MPGALRIDFAAAHRGGRFRGTALLVAGMAAAAAVGAGHLQLAAEAEAVQARSDMRLQKLRQERGGVARIGPRELRALHARVEASNRILHALDQPWIRLFDDVESAQVDGIALLALEPNRSAAAVRLVGEARDRDTLSRYLERLGRLGSLSEVRLTQHEVRHAKGASGLRFSVSARWMRPS